jgi:transposase
MDHTEGTRTERGIRVRWKLAEKRRIVELTFLPEASVARVAQAEGVNTNQLFRWRREYQAGQLEFSDAGSTALLPVVVADEHESLKADAYSGFHTDAAAEPMPQPVSTGSIHIDLHGCAAITVEHGADGDLLRTILETLRR